MEMPRILAGTIIALLSLPLTVLADIRYSITDLGALPGDTNSYPTAINSFGQVTGYSFVPGVAYHAWLYNGGTLAPLTSQLGNGSKVLALNDVGQLAGESGSATGFLYSNGTVQNLGNLGSDETSALGLNNSGTVVGFSRSGINQRAFTYSNGSMQDLGTLPGGGTATAYAINSSGQIAGSSGVPGSTHAFFYDGTMHDLGTLGGSASGALGINDLGHAVGNSQITGSTTRHAFLYANGVMEDLVTLSGSPATFAFDTFAESVNDSDQVVGYGDGLTINHAFLYRDSVLYNLNDLVDPSSGITLINAVGINDSGQIVAYGSSPQLSDNIHSFLLTPTPEPASALALAAAGFALLTRRGAGGLH